MNEMLLNKMDGKKVSFVGELIGQAEGNVESTDGLDREFALKLFRIKSGGFVPVIEYESNDSREQAGCIAEIVDLFKDVENFFFVFVPEDLLSETKELDRDDLEARKKLAVKLRKTYENLSFTFLEEMSAMLDPNRNSETTESNGQKANTEL
jgi:hypothetical protein